VAFGGFFAIFTGAESGDYDLSVGEPLTEQAQVDRTRRVGGVIDECVNPTDTFRYRVANIENVLYSAIVEHYFIATLDFYNLSRVGENSPLNLANTAGIEVCLIDCFPVEVSHISKRLALA
jgi:hypothetical protein